MIADAVTGVEDIYSLKQIQTVIRPRSYPRLCQFLTKIMIVINLVCACVKTSAEDVDFQRLSERERETVCAFISLERFYVSVCHITSQEREREGGERRERMCVRLFHLRGFMFRSVI